MDDRFTPTARLLMARVASYQVLRDTSQGANLTESTYAGEVPRGFRYVFTVPARLVTDSNRARPIFECQMINTRSSRTALTFSVGAAHVKSVELTSKTTKLIREVFDWRGVTDGALVAGGEIEVTALFNPLHASSAHLSDIVIWYQVDTGRL